MRGMFDSAPNPPYLTEVLMALDYGILPDAGGLDDQAAPFVDMLVIAWSERAEMAREKAIEERRRLEDLGRSR